VPAKLQLKFDANQEHQFQAVESIVHLFNATASQQPLSRKFAMPILITAQLRIGEAP
jgi:hypothetical protein